MSLIQVYSGSGASRGELQEMYDVSEEVADDLYYALQEIPLIYDTEHQIFVGVCGCKISDEPIGVPLHRIKVLDIGVIEAITGGDAHGYDKWPKFKCICGKFFETEEEANQHAKENR